MLMTRASEYAVLSLIVLSKSDKPLDSEKLSKELMISKSFLAKILQALARNGVLNSYKGINGGFSLKKEAKDIDLLSVILSVEGKTPNVFECSTSMDDCPSNKANICLIWPFLNKLQGKIDNFLSKLTLEDILKD